MAASAVPAGQPPGGGIPGTMAIPQVLARRSHCVLTRTEQVNALAGLYASAWYTAPQG
jgi:hypothetical protein